MNFPPLSLPPLSLSSSQEATLFYISSPSSPSSLSSSTTFHPPPLTPTSRDSTPMKTRISPSENPNPTSSLRLFAPLLLRFLYLLPLRSPTTAPPSPNSLRFNLRRPIKTPSPLPLRPLITGMKKNLKESRRVKLLLNLLQLLVLNRIQSRAPVIRLRIRN